MSSAVLAKQIWDMKYRLKPDDVTIEDTWRRIAKALAAVEKDPAKWSDLFYSALEGYKFLPAGRIIAGAGTDRNVTLFNCLAGETKVLTDQGLREIRDLAGGYATVLDANGVSYGTGAGGTIFHLLPNGDITTNERFTDMKGLCDYVHSKGLKVGIYSSPGPQTCGGYTGSYKHEEADAASYAKWGIDYLKYDWCSYGSIVPNPDLAGLKLPYTKMHNALEASSRDIVYSLCQYGMGDVFKWGHTTGGNLWRTTGDITDSWSSMAGIGFDHSRRSPFAGPGGWNDPDMLVVGWLGWGPRVRPTNLTKHEQVTHITLWSMLAAPLLLGCDLTRIDDFTQRLICNPEVVGIDQDSLGKAAVRIWESGKLEIWSRPLDDGSSAIAIFNRGHSPVKRSFSLSDMGIKGILAGKKSFRDLWMRKDLGRMAGLTSVTVPAHGALLYKVK